MISGDKQYKLSVIRIAVSFDVILLSSFQAVVLSAFYLKYEVHSET